MKHANRRLFLLRYFCTVDDRTNDASVVDICLMLVSLMGAAMGSNYLSLILKDAKMPQMMLSDQMMH